LKILESTRSVLLAGLLVTLSPASADQAALPKALYLANTGVMVENGETRILFDPLFRYPHAYYQAVPPLMEEALFKGIEPFHGIDAIFISHFHADHWSPELVLALLRAREGIDLFAPAQAVKQLLDIKGPEDEAVFERVTAVDLAYREAPWTVVMDDIRVEAVMIPHSGWPAERVRSVQNIAWRVTLDDTATVLHMGDADPDMGHFSHHAEHWEQPAVDMAFPPYWFFLDPEGRRVLDEVIGALENVGVHIAADPDERPLELSEFDVFTQPGETRLIGDRP
jgi:L-ascorbate metabolism protein UlaG (beta-lactamase superfamily)